MKKSVHISDVLRVHKATRWLVIWPQETQSHVLGCSSFLWLTWHLKCVALFFTEEPYFSCSSCFPVSLLWARVDTRASGSSLKCRKAAVVLWLTSSGSLRNWITSTVQTPESGSRYVWLCVLQVIIFEKHVYVFRDDHSTTYHITFIVFRVILKTIYHMSCKLFAVRVTLVFLHFFSVTS